MNKNKGLLNNLPNALSTLRLLLIPAVIICLHFTGRWGSFLGALFFSIAALTDLLDGYYARRFKVVTSFGKFLDPLADKLLISSTLIILVAINRAPAWIAILIIAREMAVTVLRGAAGIEGKFIEVSILGKFKTIFQSVALIGLSLHYSYFRVNFHAVGMFFLWAALILALWSGFLYFKMVKKTIL